MSKKISALLLIALLLISLVPIYIFEYELGPRNSFKIRTGKYPIKRSERFANKLLSTVHEQATVVPFFPRINRRQPLPPLESLVKFTDDPNGNKTIIGDVSDLLDFAIIGFAKCGTSTMMAYLHQPPLSTVFQHERCDVGYDLPGKLVPALYKTLTKTKDTLLGIKCPRNIDDSMNNFSIFFPKTKFIIALRHPVQWFQSLYNFRINNEGRELPDPNLLTGGHIAGCKGVFANRVLYHFMLARLGKTPLDETELSLVLGKATKTDIHDFYDRLLVNTGNKVFLYHVEQLPSAAEGVLPERFVTDLTNFLGLQTNNESFLGNSINRWIPGKKLENEAVKKYRDSLKINICDARYQPLRTVLTENGRISAQWFREYFLHSPDVVVPSGTSFDMLMDKWAVDPCLNKQELDNWLGTT